MSSVNETSNGFREELFFLSNFFEAPIDIEYQGLKFTFPTSEHVFQAMKVAASVMNAEANIKWLKKMEATPLPVKSKYLGKVIDIDVPKWNAMSENCMRRTLELKLTQHPELMQQLVDTADLVLVEYNSWNDQLWGKNEKTGKGQNKLGILLMELRAKQKVLPASV